MLKLDFKLENETKTCFRYQHGSREGGDLTTLYLKKADVERAGINPRNGVTVTVEEGKSGNG